jgi:hypothetical protein
MRQLFITSLTLLLPTVASAGTPIVLDTYGKPDTQVVTRNISKQGSPWGWVAELSVFVKVDKTESDDVLVIQHREGGKAWGAPQKCALAYFDEIDHVAEFQCKMDEALAIDRAGKFSADIAYKQVGAGKTFDGIGSLKYSVRKYNCDNRHINKRFAPSPCFVVDHDFRIGETWLEETRPRHGDVVVELDDTQATEIYLRTWIKTGANEPSKMNLRCFYKDKVITKDGLNREQARVAYQEFPKANGPQHDVVWRKWWFALPDVFGRPPAKGEARSGHYLSQNPGDYRCVATSDGDQVAEFRFAVAADGRIQHAPCLDDTRVSAVTVSDRMHLIKATFKSGFNVPFDASAYKSKPFYGKSWMKGCPP